MTEQDVVNEEMYEEEDDDLPMQYRRLTAHLQTGSADFNRRLSNYLTNHVAMRSALDQAITNAYAQQYPGAPQFAHNQAQSHNTYPSPFPPQSGQQRQSPTLFQPYPSPGTPGIRPGQPARSASMSQSTSSYSSGSMPAPTSAHTTPLLAHRGPSGSPKSSSHSPQAITPLPADVQRNLARTQISPSSGQQAMQSLHSRRMSAPVRTGFHNRPMQTPQPAVDDMVNISPFTTSLPPESQMLLGSALDPSDPTTAMLMAGSEDFPMPWNFSNVPKPKPRPRAFNQSFDGMSTTLAPSAMDMQSTQQRPQQQQSAFSMNPPPIQNSVPDTGDRSGQDFTKPQQQNIFNAPPSSQGSEGSTTGLDSGWDAFINDGSWAENPT